MQQARSLQTHRILAPFPPVVRTVARHGPDDGRTSTGQCPNVNQLTLTKSAGWPLVKRRNTVCVPVTAEILAGTVRHACQPPVLAIAKLPIGALFTLSSRTSTRPLTPPAAPEATRAEN